MAQSSETGAVGFPGTPVTTEAKAGAGHNPVTGIRRVGLRAEIDTSLPFGSVKEAVTRFGGSGPWMPLYKLGENSIEDFDLKKVEDEAANLEKDLIVKELETLDVLEELGATKTILEELKQQLQAETLKCFATQGVSSIDQVGAPVRSNVNIASNQGQMLPSPSPCAMSSPDDFLVELKQAKVNLGKTINDLRVMQSSVESLNKKIKKERLFLEKTREELASKFAPVSTQEMAHKEARLKPQTSPIRTRCTFDNHLNDVKNFNFGLGQNNGMVETRSCEVSKPLSEYGENGLSMKTAEMRWFAAKKMEEAAIAAEAVALAEIEALSSAEKSSRLVLPEHNKHKLTFELGDHSPLHPIDQIPEECTLKKVIDSKLQIEEINASKLAILKKLEEATEEVLHSKQVLIEALNSVESANKKQHAAKEALRRWIPQDSADFPLREVTKSTTVENHPKRISKSSVSMRDVLSRKQVPEECSTTKEMEENAERKIALSQMLQALREELILPTIPENDENNQKEFTAQRKKFGFIHISLPLGKRSKRKT